MGIEKLSLTKGFENLSLTMGFENLSLTKGIENLSPTWDKLPFRIVILRLSKDSTRGFIPSLSNDSKKNLQKYSAGFVKNI